MKIPKFLQSAKYAAAYFCAALLVTACGGGGGSPGEPGNAGGNTPSQTASSIDLSSSANTIPSGGQSAAVKIVAVVKDAGNAAIPNHPIKFSTNYGSLSPVTQTDEKGVATTELTPPSDSSAESRANREIWVEASARGASKTIKIQVTGTKLELMGDQSLGLGHQGTYQVVARDSAGNLIAGARLTVSSVKGAHIEPSVITTDANGQAEFKYTPQGKGVDTVSVSGLGTSQRIQINVGASLLTFQETATLWAVGKAHAVTARLRDGSGAIPPVGTRINFNTTRGCIVANAAATSCGAQPVVVADMSTNAVGEATVWLLSPDTGSVVVTATTSAGDQAIAKLEGRFISIEPTRVFLQANPNALQPSTVATNNQSVLEAKVLDDRGNPVQDVEVSFSIVADPSGGRLSAASAKTDVSGRALNTFYAGPRGTGANQVIIRAALRAKPEVNQETRLTVGGEALSIAITSQSLIEETGQKTSYRVLHAVYVTNSAGTAVAAQPLSIRVEPFRYATGRRCWNGKVWANVFGSENPNEDFNFNGVRDAGEPGTDGLKPGFIANIVPAKADGTPTAPGGGVVSVMTDSDGFAYFYLQYGKDYAGWAAMKVVATAQVGGSESRASTPGAYLTALLSDVNKEDTRPPGEVSPYGTAGFSGCPSVAPSTPPKS